MWFAREYGLKVKVNLTVRRTSGDPDPDTRKQLSLTSPPSHFAMAAPTTTVIKSSLGLKKKGGKKAQTSDVRFWCFSH